jgi:predicted TIM-barrel fold metal-dependent hydrolase
VATTQSGKDTQRRKLEHRPSVIDCDVHNALRAKDVLKSYLPARWHTYYDQGVANGGATVGLVVGAKYTPGGSFSLEASPTVGPPGCDVDLMREQLLEGQGVQKAILHPIGDVVGIPTYGEAALAMAAAVNDWMVAEWFDADSRFYGAITVPVEDGARAAKEIQRTSSNPRFVKVLLPSPTQEALGHPRYWPIYEAAVEHDLPVALHPGGVAGAPGASAYFIEFHAATYPQGYATQITSLVYSGVFDRFPSLQIVLEEGGLSWMPPLMWRLDRSWRSMRDHVPHLEQKPSEVIREHVWFTTQPFDSPEKPAFLPQLLECLNMTDRIMFSSDYPHWDFDDPKRVLPASIVGSRVRDQILSRNALRLFRFEDA